MNNEDKRINIVKPLVLATAVAAGILAVQWILQHPDVARQINMRASLVVKRRAQRAADSLQKVANDAGTRYNELRSTIL